MKKESAHQESLNAIKRKVVDLDLRKFLRMNKLPFLVAVRPHQLKFAMTTEVIPDLHDKIVVSTDQLLKLSERVQSIDAEKELLKQSYFDQKRQTTKAEAARQEKLNRLNNLKAKLTELQVLKFGKVVDLDKLDTSAIQGGTDDLKASVATSKKEAIYIAKKLSTQLRHLEVEHQRVLRENTETLREVLRRKEAINACNAKFSHVTAHGDIVKSVAPEKLDIAKEKLDQKQRELDDMRGEIDLLSRSTRNAPMPTIPDKRASSVARPKAPFTDSMFNIGEARSIVATPRRKYSLYPSY